MLFICYNFVLVGCKMFQMSYFHVPENIYHTSFDYSCDEFVGNVKYD